MIRALKFLNGLMNYCVIGVVFLFVMHLMALKFGDCEVIGRLYKCYFGGIDYGTYVNAVGLLSFFAMPLMAALKIITSMMLYVANRFKT
jgi:hypothetical protein